VDEPIDYEKTRFEDVVHDLDVEFDPVGGDTQKRSWKTLKKGGILVSIVAPPSAEEAKKHDVRSAFLLLREVHRCWLNLQRSSIPGKSSRWLRLCCRCPKPDTLTNSMKQDMLGARSS
jgi:NADPH:quinone reductase-like Zn-dependent oxidoreductase